MWFVDGAFSKNTVMQSPKREEVDARKKRRGGGHAGRPARRPQGTRFGETVDACNDSGASGAHRIGPTESMRSDVEGSTSLTMSKRGELREQ